MPRNQRENRPSCPEAYAYIEEAQARLDGSKPIRRVSQHCIGDYDEGRSQVWYKIPKDIINQCCKARYRAGKGRPLRVALAFNIAWFKEHYAP